MDADVGRGAGVDGLIICNNEGVAIKTTFDADKTVQYASLATRFTHKSISAVTALEPDDKLQFLRIRSKMHEIVIAPHDNYTLIIQQRPQMN